MRNKRTHRILCEALETRRLLTSYLHYLNETTGLETAIASGGNISAYTDVPLHVTGAPEPGTGTGSGGVDFGDSSDDAAIKAEWQWNFDDPNGEYNQLNGFNAAHIYSYPGNYVITLTVTNQYGTPMPFTLNVNVISEPFDNPTANFGETVYVAATASGGGDGSDPADAMDIATLEHRLNSPDPDFPAIPSDSQMLFKNGDEFSVSSELDISQVNILISSWYSIDAEHPTPVLDNPNVYSSSFTPITIETESDAINVVVSNIGFTDSGGGGELINVEGKNLAIESCKFTSLLDETTCVDAQSTGAAGLFLADNTVNDTGSEIQRGRESLIDSHIREHKPAGMEAENDEHMDEPGTFAHMEYFKYSGFPY